MLQFFRRHWYDIGAIVAVFATRHLYVNWQATSVPRRLLLANFIALLVHQFEEYGWPGGEPAVMNMVLSPSPQPDRYPLNQNSAMVINCLAAYTFYLIPAVYEDIPWLGLAPTFFGFGQFVVHGIVTNYKLVWFYNPGLAAVVLLHYPIGIQYIRFLRKHNLVTPRDWLLTVVYLGLFVWITFIKMTYTWLARMDSPYVFSEEEMKRWDVPARLARLQ